MSNVAVLTATLGAAVATNGTIDFLYASAAGVTQSTVISGSEVLSVPDLSDVLDQDASTFTVAYDADSATITYKGATTIPAGSTCKLQVRVAGGEATVLEQPNIANIGGAPAQADFNGLLAALRSAGILVS